MHELEQLDVDSLVADIAARLKKRIAEQSLTNPALVGIRTGGVWLAQRLQKKLKLAGPIGELNIAFYRDDFSRIGMHPTVEPSALPFDVNDRHLLLVDDILYTGRTIRAAMNEIFDYGRPRSISLVVYSSTGAAANCRSMPTSTARASPCRRVSMLNSSDPIPCDSKLARPSHDQRRRPLVRRTHVR
jgi:pyrimidine operon attenuation protein/uracil phosphoribosyltransferase